MAGSNRRRFLGQFATGVAGGSMTKALSAETAKKKGRDAESSNGEAAVNTLELACRSWPRGDRDKILDRPAPGSQGRAALEKDSHRVPQFSTRCANRRTVQCGRVRGPAGPGAH